MSLGDPRKPNSRSTVTGFDATFAAPKSFSILWILAKEEERTQLDQVWQQSLKEAIAEFEKEAAVGRIGHGGTDVSNSQVLPLPLMIITLIELVNLTTIRTL